MRVFTAVELPLPLRERVAAVTAPLFDGLRGVRIVVAENLHVTVRFLGEVAEGGLSELIAALSEAAESVPACEADAEGLGAFPNLRRPRVVWCGVAQGAGTFEALEMEVSAALEPFGYRPENRPFHPHITLARLKPGRKTVSVLRARLEEVGEEAPRFGSFPVDHLTVFRSHLNTRGAVRYEVLERLSLRPE